MTDFSGKICSRCHVAEAQRHHRLCLACDAAYHREYYKDHENRARKNELERNRERLRREGTQGRMCSRCQSSPAHKTHRWCLPCNAEYKRERLLNLDRLTEKRLYQNAYFKRLRTTDPSFTAKHTEANKRWRRTPAGSASFRASSQRRRARKAAVENTLTAAQWTAILETSKGRCHYCKKKTARMTMDHVIPLSLGGAHAAYNIVAACGHCNKSKGAKRLLLL